MSGERLSADGGSAGAISGPPQMKSLKKQTVVRGPRDTKSLNTNASE
jgi:hypothetical protein